MTHVFHRSTKATPPVAVAGEGVYIIDADGRRYLDGSGGAAVSCLGHGHPAVIEAVRDQAASMAYAHNAFFTSAAAETLAETLVDGAPGDLDRVCFTSGGSESIEAAIKLARQYHLEAGAPDRRYVIARRQSYHGNTLGALAASGNAGRRRPYEPLLSDAMRHVSPCYAYRHCEPDETPEDYGARLAAELDAEIGALGPENVAAFLAETVVGATLGAVPAVPDYFGRIREVCDRHGVLLILDEVMCGMGRTGSMFACEQEGIVPDMVAVAKGLGAGYQPIGAALVSRRIHDAIAAGSAALMGGQTYMAHPTACAAALAVQRVLRQDGMIATVMTKGKTLEAALLDRFGNHGQVGDMRGRGLFWGLEFVSDRANKEPFDPSLGFARRLRDNAFELGLICYPGSGTADGAKGDHVLIAPPFIVSDAQIIEIVDVLSRAVDLTVDQIRPGAWVGAPPR